MNLKTMIKGNDTVVLEKVEVWVPVNRKLSVAIDEVFCGHCSCLNLVPVDFTIKGDIQYECTNCNLWLTWRPSPTFNYFYFDKIEKKESKSLIPNEIEAFKIQELIDLWRARMDFTIVPEKDFIKLMLSRRPLELLLMAQSMLELDNLSAHFKIPELSGIQSNTIQELINIVQEDAPTDILSPGETFTDFIVKHYTPMDLLLMAFYNTNKKPETAS